MAGNVYMGVKRLPSGYTRVEYIESSGTQYIDTGFKPSSNTRLVLSGYNTSSDSVWIAGSWNGASTCTFTVRFPTEFYYGGNTTNLGLGTILGTFEIDFNKNVVSVNGTSKTMPAWSFTGSYNMYLFALNAAGNVSSGRFIGRIYSCKIYDNGTLVRDFVPCYRDSDRVVGLYDAVHRKFYTNAGTGTFTCPLPPMELPQGYTQVEYIESGGTQYIDTGLQPYYNTRVVMDFQFTSAPSSDHAVIFGARNSSTSKNFCVFYVTSGYFRSDYNASNTQQWAINSTARYIIDKNKGTTSLNGTTQSYSGDAFACSYNMYLFALNGGGYVYYKCDRLRVFSCQIYDNGTLIRNFVPCINANGVAGLYDMENGVFYGNSGTGSFTAGETYEVLESEDVAREVEKKYIGINGVAREVEKAYFGDENGIAQEWFSIYTKIGSLPVGSSVFMNEGKTRTEFIVAHQGLPSTKYDDSCNGTWLLRKSLGTSIGWGILAGATYAASPVHRYLNNEYISLFDDSIKNIIKQVKIPYSGEHPTHTYYTGSDGLLVKAFCLSSAEISYPTTGSNKEGAVLSYFTSDATAKRSTGYEWYLRSPVVGSHSEMYFVNTNGLMGSVNMSTHAYYIRPALILPSSTLVDDNFNVLA